MKTGSARKRRPVVEEIEPRILYSADFAPALADAAAFAPQAEQRVVEASGEFTQTQDHQSRRHEIVFVDPATPDYAKLIDDIRAQKSDRDIEVVMLDAGKDGIRQITKTLAGRDDISAVHVVSHGTDGAVQLGKSSLNFDSLLKNASKIKGWADAFGSDADILIYGCDVAASAQGRSLVEALARLTGADVAASDDRTGQSDLGGDWDLEFHAGQIETSIAFSESVVLDWRATLPATAAGGETLINTTTGGMQQIDGAPTRAIAMDASGNYVVVWSGNGTGDGSGVFAQRYDANGVAQGSEIRVNGSTANTQTDPSVAMDVSGNFVVAWTSDHASAGNNEVYARRFAANGTPIAGEFQVNSFTTGSQSAPVVSMNASGAFVIAWESGGQDGSGSGVYAQRYNAAGAAQAGEFLVNSITAGNQSIDSVALDAAGNFVLTFAGPDADMNGVYMKRYNAAGTALSGDVLVNTTTTNEQSWSSLAMDPTGNYVVVWRSVNQDGSSGGIYGQRVNASGVAQGAEFQINTNTANDQANPSVSMDVDGNFVVTWASSGQDGSGWGIYEREYDADGTANGGDVRVNTTTTNNQVNPWVAMNPDRDFVVVWGGEGSGDTTGVFAQRYSFGLVVDTVSDTADGNTTSIAALLADKGADGHISLREAITAANNTANANVSTPDKIYFNIPGSGAHVITLGSLLPNVNEAVVLDGSTDPNFAGMPVIEVRGGGTVANAFNVAAGGAGSTIRGFVISGFSTDSIVLTGGNNLIAGNYVGTNAVGSAVAATPNADGGIRILTGSNSNTIGGTTALDRNIFSGNGGGQAQDNEISLHGGNNLIIGNYIGVAADGTTVIGNLNDGIDISTGATNNIVGGTNPGEGNLIAGHTGGGVRIQNNAIGTLIRGNAIWGNGSGVAISGASTGHLIQQNSIYGNTNLGIDLATNGVTANDGAKTAGQPNLLMDFPVIQSVTLSGTTLILSGYIGAAPGDTDFAGARVEFFKSLDAAGVNGEGETYLGFLTADASGNFSGSFTVSGLAAGDRVTTAATDGSDNTSEFGLNVAVTATNSAPVLADTVATLNSVNEDANAPIGAVGTLISVLVGGVTDADSGAVKGIAITAADATNGTWWYSTDNGANWNLLGTPSAVSSRLLAADANTRLCFQPNPDFNGTLATVITFRAWDQTSGSGGSTANTTSNGGTTAFSSATDTASLTINAVNDAPTVTNGASVSLTGTNEDTTSGGMTVNAILTGASWADVDSAALKGIAVTAVTGGGTWQYSTDGITWTSFGSVSGASALLLDSASQVRYVPNGQNGETATFSFRAWDKSTGSASTNGSPSTANPGAGGGTSAYSTQSASASIVVTSLNDAPALDNSGTMSLTGITEDDTTNAGDLVSAIIASAGGDRIADVDSSAVEGIAVTALVSGNGTWQYSTDGGGSWNAVGAVSNNSALLLRTLDRLRFVPDGLNADMASLSFRAWDQTGGTQGTKVDVSINGGSTAFSSAIETASLAVTAVNDAPIISGVVGDALTYGPGSGAQILDQGGDATVLDGDSADLNGGVLTVTITAGGSSSEDVLSVRNEGSGAGQIGFSGGNVTYGGVFIGTAAGGSAGTPLAVTFNASATPTAASGLLRNISYRNTDSVNPTAGARTLTYSMSDGDGGISGMSTATVTIANTIPPAGSDDNYSVSEDATLAAGWWNAQWSRRQQITFDNAARPEDLDNFPVLITLDATNIDYAETQNGGQDLRFLDGDGTPLAYEVERWDEAGTSYVWVNVPRIDASSATDHIWMYYGNASAAPGEDAAGVWTSGYRAVYHLTDAGVAIGESSGNTSGAVNNGSTDVGGAIGRARSFDGIDDWIRIGNGVNLASNASVLTVSAWVNTNNLATDRPIVAVSVNAGIPQDSRIALEHFDGGDIRLIIRPDDATRVVLDTTTDPITAGSWYYVVGVVDVTNNLMQIYVNGSLGASQASSFTSTQTLPSSSDFAAIGSQDDGTSGYSQGLIDEVRLAAVGRSSNWINAEYLNATGGLVTFGGAQSAPAMHGVLGNDTDPDSVDLTAILASGPANAAAFTLNADGTFTYTPNADFAGIDTFTYRANDGANDSNVATVTITVNPINDAPVLADTLVTLNPVNEDAGAPSGGVGTLISSLVGGVSDVDTAALKGIAITGADAANGTWWYSTNNGASWGVLGTPSAASSRLLAADANTRLYFQPNADYNGTLATAITFRAWDRSSGANGGTVDTTSNGGTTAFSSATDTASLVVNPVNDAPTGLPTISGTPAEDQILTADTSGIGDVDGLGAFGYQWLRNGVAVGGATATTYTLGDADVGTQISVRVSYTDGFGTPESVTSAQTAAVANVNDAPTGVPTISGTPTEDQTLTASIAGIADADGLGAFNYQWLRNGVAIGGATAGTYTLGDADVGTQISVQVSYTDAHGTSEGPLGSAQTAPVANVNDAPVGLPTISGTVTEDQMLTANTAGIVDADGLGAFRYQWLRNGAAIGGATAGSYTLGDVDVGTQISVQVSFTDGQGTAENVTSAQTVPVANVNDAPTGVPTISGTATEGQTLTANTGGIADIDGLGAFSYQWLRNGVAVGGATSNTYTLGDADVGTQISIQVSYTDGHGTAESLTSAQTAAVANVNDAPVGIPTITGTSTEDQTLTANTAGIADADGLGAFSYQWLRNGAVIGGATASTYALGDADVGTQISLEVSYTDAHGTSEGPLTSAQTAPVANVNDVPAGVPTISGTVTEDQTLTANTGGISDADGLGAFSYQWLRNGIAIGGATTSTYTLGDADVATQISVQVSYTDGQGTAESVSSAQTAPVANVNDAPVGIPTITGTPTENQLLAANTAGISDADGLGAFGYQWLRNGVAIGGATASTYTLGSADVGTQISVQVSYTDANGTGEGPLASAQTAPVANVNNAPVGVPTITGTVTEDQTLTANTGGISDADGLGAFSYQWLRNGAAIGGATANTYTLGDADVGAQISVQVSYTDGQGTAESLTSAQTSPVANVNDAPVLTANSLSIGQGATLTLSGANLGASDVDNAAGTLSFTVSSVANGRFELSGAPGMGITSFTQADVAGGLVVFVHDGSALAPSYAVTVSDGALVDGPQSAGVSFTPRAAVAVIPVPPSPPVVLPTPVVEEPPAESEAAAEPEREAPGAGAARATPAVFSPGRIDPPEAQFNQLEVHGLAVHRLIQPVATLNTFVSGPHIDPTLALLAAAPVNLQYLPTTPVDWSVRPAFPDAEETPQDRIDVLLEQVQVGGMALSVGVVWWASRVSGLLGSLLASAPAWRHIDPLPVVGRDEDEDKKWYDPDDPDDRDADANELAIANVLDGAQAVGDEQRT